MKDEKIEVVRYADAPWAPTIGIGESFDWAIRVTSFTGNQLTTVCNGTKKQALAKARNYLQRLRKQFNGEMTHRIIQMAEVKR